MLCTDYEISGSIVIRELKNNAPHAESKRGSATSNLLLVFPSDLKVDLSTTDEKP